MAQKNTLRTSSYLNAVDVGGGVALLYNGFTSRIDLVPSDVARQLISDKGRRDFSFLLPGEAQHLLNRGHLTELTAEHEQEEFRKLAEHILNVNEKFRQRKNINRAIAFILTYKCNLACSYCYQSELRKNEKIPPMSEALVDRFFLLYFNKLFPRCHKKSINFQLFGGEPLLPGNRTAIERILHYAKKYGSLVSTATNAVMLPKMLDLVGPEKGKIQNVQVTLDGERLFHDELRVTQSGAPTFEEIIRSLRELIKVKTNTSIRIHLHPNRIESTRELVEYLEGEGILGHDHVDAYFAPISSFDDEEPSRLYREELSRLFQRVALLQNGPPSLFARGLAGILEPVAVKSPLKSRYCAVGTALLRIVDSLGDVYDCYEEAGNRARRIAKLADEEVKYFRLNNTYAKRHILNLPQCLKCSIALFCGGGCMSQARLQHGSIFKPFCQQNKEFVKQTLKACFLLQRAGKSTSEAGPDC